MKLNSEDVDVQTVLFLYRHKNVLRLDKRMSASKIFLDKSPKGKI